VRTRWITAGSLAGLAALTLACGAGSKVKSGNDGAAAPPTTIAATQPSAVPSLSASPVATTASSAVPVIVLMPDMVGENGAIALDKLTKLGFSKIELAPVDGHSIVVLAANWTVRQQSTKPGEKVPSDTLIVLGCAKN